MAAWASGGLSGLAPLFIYSHSLKAEYRHSPVLQHAFAELRRNADLVFLSPRVPDAIRHYYTRAVAWLSQLGTPA